MKTKEDILKDLEQKFKESNYGQSGDLHYSRYEVFLAGFNLCWDFLEDNPNYFNEQSEDAYIQACRKLGW